MTVKPPTRDTGLGLRPDTGSPTGKPQWSGTSVYRGGGLPLGWVAALALCALAAWSAWSVYGAALWPRLEPRTCTAQQVADGDTLKVQCGALGSPATVRLADVDAPEAAECPEAARAAKARLAALVDAQPLRVTPRYRDRWGRVVATVETPAGDLGAALLSTGHAHPWPHTETGRPLAARPKGC